MRLSLTTRLPSSLSEAESKAVRAWLDHFRQHGGVTATTSKHSHDWSVTYSRSSGPGGQNVNKVNTKATLKLDLDRAAKWLPKHTLINLRDTPYYAPTSNSLILHSMRHRTQAANSQDCLQKLEEVIVDASKQGLQGEATEEKKEHVKGLIRAFKARTRAEKQRHHDLKRSRSKVSFE